MRRFNSLFGIQMRSLSSSTTISFRTSSNVVFSNDEDGESAKLSYLQSVGDPTGEFHPELVGRKPVEEIKYDYRDDYSDDELSRLSMLHSMCAMKS